MAQFDGDVVYLKDSDESFLRDFIALVRIYDGEWSGWVSAFVGDNSGIHSTYNSLEELEAAMNKAKESNDE